MSLYDELKLNVETGKKDAVQAQITQALAEGYSPQEILQEGLIAAMDVVGAKM